MPKRFGSCCALLALSTSALAESRGPAARLESTLWDHDGSVMYLLALGAAREFHYREPRAGMVEAGARPGALLFRGTVANGQFAGTAFIFDRRCGQLPYPVSGPILDHDERVVLTGEAPLVGAKCRVQGHFTEVLEFRLQNANKTARALAPENAPSPPLPTEERAAPPTPSRESQSPSPAVAADAAPAPKAAAAPPSLPAGQNAPAVVADVAPAPKAVAAPPPRPPAQTPPAVVADAVLAPKAPAAPLLRPSTPAPDLTAEIERTRTARQQAAAAAEAAQAAELAAHRASAEAEAARAAAEAHVQQNRDELQAARDENSDERSRQYLILAAMAWTLLLSGVAIVLLFAKLRRSQSPLQTENPKTEDASAATMTRSSVYSRFSESIAQADAASAAKSHGYQSGGRVRVFFQTRASHPSGNSSALRRVGYAPR